jgi:hypothetical protein
MRACKQFNSPKLANVPDRFATPLFHFRLMNSCSGNATALLLL